MMEPSFGEFPACRILAKWLAASWAPFVACGQTLLTMLLLVCSLALVGVASQFPPPDRVTDASESSDEDLSRSRSQRARPEAKLISVLVPGPIVQLSESECRSQLLGTYEEARAVLENRGCQDLWYALLYRTISENGHIDELSYFRRPAQDPLNFREFQFVVELITKHRDLPSQENDNSIALMVIPEELEHTDPRIAISAALDAATTLDQWLNDHIQRNVGPELWAEDRPDSSR